MGLLGWSLAMTPCSNCRILTAQLYAGECVTCFGETVEALPEAIRSASELAAIDASRGCGLAITSAFGEQTVRLHGVRVARRAAPLQAAQRFTTKRRARTSAEFTTADADDLAFYFRCALPPAYGDSSLFGEMLKRIRETVNPKTDQWPTGPECEWVQPSRGHSAGNFDAVENAMHRYLESRGQVSRAHTVLRLMRPELVDLLEAKYSVPTPLADRTEEQKALVAEFGQLWAVAETTPEASKLRAESFVASGKAVDAREAIAAVIAVSRRKKPTPEREIARAQVVRVAEEARRAVDKAEGNYVGVAMALESQ